MTLECLEKPQQTPVLENGTKSSLAIVEDGFRGSLEEQYANIVWLSECMRLMKSNHNLLLMGSAVACAFKHQTRKSLQIGSIEVSTVGHMPDAVTRLIEKGAKIWVLERDLIKFQADVELIDGVERAASLSSLVAAHEKAWFW